VDDDFLNDRDGLMHAVDLLGRKYPRDTRFELSATLPETGLRARAVLDRLAPIIFGGAERLGVCTAFAHMDPPTPWVTWTTTLWNASLNQNLLHPATAPVARAVEDRVIAWLCPFFGMSGGHMTFGSSLANLTALWAARDCAGVQEVVASEAAHVSVAKAARILGLRLRTVPVDECGALDASSVPTELRKSALVLTAGTTATGAIDPLVLAGRAAWTHVDAAWAAPLRLTIHAERLAGIDLADSGAVSAHT
jgi:L-2,4-diaminobutyrate decarboxylase